MTFGLGVFLEPLSVGATQRATVPRRSDVAVSTRLTSSPSKRVRSRLRWPQRSLSEVGFLQERDRVPTERLRGNREIHRPVVANNPQPHVETSAIGHPHAVLQARWRVCVQLPLLDVATERVGDADIRVSVGGLLRDETDRKNVNAGWYASTLRFPQRSAGRPASTVHPSPNPLEGGTCVPSRR